jgi:site-specific DNA-cytosine methylase
MTLIKARIESGEVPAPDVIVGGTPCQAYSIAGLRRGLADSRGALTLAYVELINAIDKKRSEEGKKPAIIIWENVQAYSPCPTMLMDISLPDLPEKMMRTTPSGKKWTDAGVVAGPTRTLAWRILDAQYFSVAQRRQRVFVVGSARDDFNPAAVLLELNSLRRDSPPSRSSRKKLPERLRVALEHGAERTMEA